MQISRAEVIPFDLQLRQPVLMAHHPQIKRVKAIFVRLETRQGQNAWGCTVTHSTLTGDKFEEVLRQCQECASLAPDLHPTNLEFSLTELANRTGAVSTVMCAFDLAFHDLLGLAAGMPLYRLLGGYRNRIQTSATVPLSSPQETIEIARSLDRQGFQMLKIKGGLDPEEDVRRVQAVHRALPNSVLRLDADGGYSVEEALDVARALGNVLEMLEQPTSPDDHAALRQVKEISPVPVLADQSVSDPISALDLAAGRMCDGLSVKLATCGGLHCARQVDAIARAARIATMVGCLIEPALLVSAGLSLALSSPNVRYADLDGHLNLANDPSHVPFTLENGWLVASDAPGLGYFQL